MYRDALSFLTAVFDSEWKALSAIEKAKTRFNTAEHLVHGTKYNIAKYDFDVHFHKMPSYLRRAAIQEALGCVSSYHSNHDNWEKGGKQGKEPKLQVERFAMPTFYNKEMYSVSEDPYSAYLKLYYGNDWVWVKVRLRGTDVRYLKRYWQHCKPSAPTLEKRCGKYYLRFAFTEKVALSDTKISEQRICAVDLGLNSDAVCSVMTSDGTVLTRKFINFPSEKDHLWHVLNRIRRYQREHGSQNMQSFWMYARRLNDDLAKKLPPPSRTSLCSILWIVWFLSILISVEKRLREARRSAFKCGGRMVSSSTLNTRHIGAVSVFLTSAHGEPAS